MLEKMADLRIKSKQLSFVHSVDCLLDFESFWVKDLIGAEDLLSHLSFELHDFALDKTLTFE